MIRAKRVKAAAELSRAGEPTRVIAEKLGVSAMQVRRDLKQSGGTQVPPAPNGKVRVQIIGSGV